VPQSYQLGQEGQVDWYEAWAELSGAPVLLQVFSMRSMASGAAFHRAYHRATQQAFLDAHEHAFNYFQGVFAVLRYNNLKAAVKKILSGYRREETARFIAFRSHWRFSSEFCSPYEAHEKGGIEGEAGYFRRNHWVPIPKARDLAELNAQLLAACREDEQRLIAGRSEPVGALMIEERTHYSRSPSKDLSWRRSCFHGSTDLAAYGCGPISIRRRLRPARRLKCDFIRVRSKCGTRDAASQSTSAALSVTSRCSTSNIISTCWNASRARSLDRSHWRRGANEGCGRKVTIGCSTN